MAARLVAVLKKVAIAVGLLLLLVAGGVGWLWHQATALPSWYTQGDLADFEAPHDETDGPAPAPQWIALDEQGQRLPDAAPVPLHAPTQQEAKADLDGTAAPAPARRRAPRQADAKRHELRGFHVRRGKDGKPRRSPAIKASRAVYEDGALEIGVILDLSKLPKDKLEERDRARYDRAVRNFPGITTRDVWVGVEDEPISVGGYLQLSPGAEVRVGNLTYSLASAAERMGMTPMEMRLDLNRELRRLGFVDPEA